MEFAILLLVITLLDIVALRWSFDSRDKIDSPEWERRKVFLLGYRNREKCVPKTWGEIDTPWLPRKIECLSDCQNF